MSDETLYEITLYGLEGEFLNRVSCIPPFESAPEIVISGTKYFVLMNDMTYHEAEGVHWLPELAPAGPEKSAG